MTAGIIMAIRMPMIVITTNNSTSVKPRGESGEWRVRGATRRLPPRLPRSSHAAVPMLSISSSASDCSCMAFLRFFDCFTVSRRLSSQSASERSIVICFVQRAAMHGVVGIVGLDANQTPVGPTGDVLDADSRHGALVARQSRRPEWSRFRRRSSRRRPVGRRPARARPRRSTAPARSKAASRPRDARQPPDGPAARTWRPPRRNRRGSRSGPPRDGVVGATPVASRRRYVRRRIVLDVRRAVAVHATSPPSAVRRTGGLGPARRRCGFRGRAAAKRRWAQSSG